MIQANCSVFSMYTCVLYLCHGKWFPLMLDHWCNAVLVFVAKSDGSQIEVQLHPCVNIVPFCPDNLVDVLRVMGMSTVVAVAGVIMSF